MDQESQRKLLYATPFAACFISALIGLSVILVWHIRSDFLITHHRWIFSMQHLTALLFITSSFGIFFAVKEKWTMAAWFGATTLFASTLVLLEYWFGVDLKIDELFLENYVHLDTAHPGRPAPNTTITFMGIGLSQILLSLNSTKPKKICSAVIETIGFVVLALGALAIGGYINSTEIAYAWWSDTQMSVQTATANIAIGASILALSWNMDNTSVAKIYLWIPAIICLFALQLDLMASPGVILSVFYIPMVFCGLWFTQIRTVFIFATIASFLIILRYFMLPIEYMNNEILINRLLVICAIWLVATMVYRQRQIDYMLQRGEKYLRSIVNYTVDGLIVINHKGIITNFNKSSESLFGYSAEEVLGKNIKMLMPSPYKENHDHFIHNYLSTGEKRIIGIGREVTGLRKNKSVFPMELSISEMHVDGKRFFSGIVRDITERKAAEQQLLKTNTELERFVFVAAHDLQEPLRTISMYSEILEEEHKEAMDDSAVKYINNMRNAAKRMRSLIKDLLEYSSMNNERLILEKTPVTKIIQMALDNLNVAIKQHKSEIVTSPNMPDVTGNTIQLVSLYQNLIGNALKYTQKDNVSKILLNVEEREYDWLFSVQDNGIGIPPQYIEQVFVPFKRLHTSNEYSGTGIGLSMCKRIVEQHGGEIWVESTLDEGSTFYFTLPMK